jgi:predicted nucleic acid-binding protein
MFLVDTNVVSELRKLPFGRADPDVVAWNGQTMSEATFISVISVMELEIGTARMERRDPAQGALLRRWLESQLLPAFRDRVLAVDQAVARRCGQLHAQSPRRERDALIAATALVFGLTVVTRNVADFAPMGVATLNPWEFAP